MLPRCNMFPETIVWLFCLDKGTLQWHSICSKEGALMMEHLKYNDLMCHCQLSLILSPKSQGILKPNLLFLATNMLPINASSFFPFAAAPTQHVPMQYAQSESFGSVHFGDLIKGLVQQFSDITTPCHPMTSHFTTKSPRQTQEIHVYISLMPLYSSLFQSCTPVFIT